MITPGGLCGVEWMYLGSAPSGALPREPILIFVCIYIIKLDVYL